MSPQNLKMSSVQMVQKYLFYNFEFPCSAGKTWSLSTKKNFSPFCSASPEIIGVKVCNRPTDRQILWHHIRWYVDFFLQLNLLPPYSLRSQGDCEYSMLFLYEQQFCIGTKELGRDSTLVCHPLCMLQTRVWIQAADDRGDGTTKQRDRSSSLLLFGGQVNSKPV